MSELLKFKYGNSGQLENPTEAIQPSDLIFVNDALNKEDATDLDAKLGSVRRGDLLVGSTKATESFLTKKIVVAGGPLASLVSQVYPDGIPAGTSMEEIFAKCLCVELYPIAATKPYISLSGNSTLGVKKVGDTVTLGAVSMTTNSGKFKSADSTWSQPAVEGVTFSDKKIVPTVNSGFEGNTLANGESVASSTAKVVLGANKVTYAGSANYTAPSNSPVTNLGNPTTKISENGADGAASFGAGTAEKTAEATATGVYPVYYNGGATNNAENPTTEVVKNDSVFEVTFGIEAAHFCKFAYPASHSITKIEVYNSAFNVWGEYSGGSSTEDITKTINGTDYDYKMWVRSGANYNEGMKFRFTLNKLTSVE